MVGKEKRVEQLLEEWQGYRDKLADKPEPEGFVDWVIDKLATMQLTTEAIQEELKRKIEGPVMDSDL